MIEHYWMALLEMIQGKCEEFGHISSWTLKRIKWFLRPLGKCIYSHHKYHSKPVFTLLRISSCDLGLSDD